MKTMEIQTMIDNLKIIDEHFALLGWTEKYSHRISISEIIKALKAIDKTKANEVSNL